MISNEVTKIFDALLSVPGMKDNVKVDMRIPRKTVFFLAQVIQRGLNVREDEKQQGILAAVSPEDIQVLQEFAKSSLEKAGLTELNQKLIKLVK